MTGRWDGDERGRGVADGGAFAAGAEELLEAMGTPDWVAEEPEAHLLPHLRRSVASLPLELVDARTSDDGSFAGFAVSRAVPLRAEAAATQAPPRTISSASQTSAR